MNAFLFFCLKLKIFSFINVLRRIQGISHQIAYFLDVITLYGYENLAKILGIIEESRINGILL